MFALSCVIFIKTDKDQWESTFTRVACFTSLKLPCGDGCIFAGVSYDYPKYFASDCYFSARAFHKYWSHNFWSTLFLYHNCSWPHRGWSAGEARPLRTSPSCTFFHTSSANSRFSRFFGTSIGAAHHMMPSGCAINSVCPSRLHCTVRLTSRVFAGP